MSFLPGEIYWMRQGDDERPCVIVSRQELNQGDWLTIVPFTTARLEERSHHGNCVAFRRGQFGLEKDCVAQAEQITAIKKYRISSDRIGQLDTVTFRELVKAVAYVLDVELELGPDE